MSALKRQFREWRVLAKRAAGLEPRIPEVVRLPLEYHGTAEGGWMIVAGSLSADSVVVDVGLGEDVAFSESIIRKYACDVSGLDPTPRAISFVSSLDNAKLRLLPFGLGTQSGRSQLFLPKNAEHVSGSLTREEHLGLEAVDVDLLTLGQLFDTLGALRINLLKLDIEGTEYDVIQSEEFRDYSSSIDQLCIEFHHRWKGRGRQSTERAVETLSRCGFDCAWYSRTTNEEFLFVRRAAGLPSRGQPAR